MRRKLTENFITVLGCVSIIGTIASLLKMFFGELKSADSETIWKEFIVSDKFILFG